MIVCGWCKQFFAWVIADRGGDHAAIFAWLHSLPDTQCCIARLQIDNATTLVTKLGDFAYGKLNPRSDTLLMQRPKRDEHFARMCRESMDFQTRMIDAYLEQRAAMCALCRFELRERPHVIEECREVALRDHAIRAEFDASYAQVLAAWLHAQRKARKQRGDPPA